MHEANANETGSAPEATPPHRVAKKSGLARYVGTVQKYRVPLVAAAVLIFFVTWLSISTSRSVSPCAFKIAENPDSLPVRLTKCISLETARTNSALILGLSGRESMPRDHGMLFIFDIPGKQCMWMKDMHFSLDMVWLDEKHRIVHIEKDLQPETYPKSFCSPKPAKYVVEVNSGIATQAGLQEGQQLNL